MENCENFFKGLIEEIKKSISRKEGGAFGACISKDGKIISVGTNSVIKDNDATAHAEINAIRKAGKKLGTHNLEGCKLYTTSYPCPMCLSAIIWANIKEVFFLLPVEDADSVGFRDDVIYKALKEGDKNILKVNKYSNISLEDKCREVLKNYSGEIY